MRTLVAAASLLLVTVLGFGCTPLARDAACVAAEKCDTALAEPFGDYAAADPVFGDVGSCWQSADTAKPCVAQCKAFLAEQAGIAAAAGDDATAAACGGVAAGEGEGEGEGAGQ